MTLTAIAERLRPIGEVRIAGQADAAQQTLALPIKPVMIDDKRQHRSGEQIYTTVCMRCHAKGAAHAPRFRQVKDWTARIDKGDDVLIQHALKGFNFMPPRGTCEDCSDKEIAAAVHYMVRHSQ